MVTLATLLLTGTLVFSAEDSWPQFRGPTGDGLASATAEPPVEWSETKNIAWKVATPGKGRSSPVIMGDRIFLTMALEEGTKRTRIGPDDMQVATRIKPGVVCLDRNTGKQLWHTTLFDIENPQPVHWLNSFATPTPVVEGNRVYCDFGAFATGCLDAETGSIVWKTQVPLDHQVGPGSSIIVYQNLLLMLRDGRSAQFVTALDKETGKTVWKVDRPPLNGSNDTRKCFSTPLLIQVKDQVQMLAVGARWIVAYEPLTGKEIWRLRHGEGFSIGARPVFGNGLAIFSTGCMKPVLLAVKTDGQGEVPATGIVWKSPRNVPVMSSPLLVGDEVYVVSDPGIASCSSAKTGDLIWQEKIGVACYASPTLADGRIYFFCNDGKAVVLKAGTKMERLGENTIEGFITASPAFLGKAIYVRTDGHMYRIESKQ
jgi:hypothetical protein